MNTNNSLDTLWGILDCIQTPMCVLNVDTDGIPTYAYCNTAILTLFARDQSVLVGNTALKAFGPEFGSSPYKEHLKTIETRIPNRFEFQFQAHESMRHVRATLVPQMDTDGRVCRLVASLEDLSDKKAAEAAQEKLTTMGNEVEQFIAMAAHDLRTPMRNVMDLAEMLLEDFDDHGDGKIDLINLLQDTARKSMNLISDVLSYASTLGPQSPDELYELGDLCHDLMSILDPQQHHNIICDRSNLFGEKSVMQIVLRNLIDNALKHGKRENMTLRCVAKFDQPDRVEISLSDDGAGFENPGVVFLETSKFRADSGYGLLAVRKLITARGGQITASNDSQTGGSCVKFSLPNATSISKQHPTGPAPQPEAIL